jgi:hypothetical protein
MKNVKRKILSASFKKNPTSTPTYIRKIKYSDGL